MSLPVGQRPRPWEGRRVPAWLRWSARLGLGRLAWRACRRQPLILMYHGVADPPPAGNFIPSEQFRHHLDGLQRFFRVVPLAELTRWLHGEGPLPDHAAAITFDDGYRTLLDFAVPELEARGLPATIFVTDVGGDELLWFDELEARGGGGVDKEELKRMPLAERDAAIGRIRREHPIDDALREPYRLLEDGQVADLAARGFDIGGHTARHPLLARETAEEQRREIVENAARLTPLLGRPPEHFAYPNGTPDDFTDRTMALVEQAGYRMAVTTVLGSARRRGSPFAVRRIPRGFFGRYGPDWLEALPLRIAAFRGSR